MATYEPVFQRDFRRKQFEIVPNATTAGRNASQNCNLVKVRKTKATEENLKSLRAEMDAESSTLRAFSAANIRLKIGVGRDFYVTILPEALFCFPLRPVRLAVQDTALSRR